MDINKVIEKMNADGYMVSNKDGIIILRTGDPAMSMSLLGELLEKYDYHNSYELILFGAAAEERRKELKKSYFGYRYLDKTKDNSVDVIDTPVEEEYEEDNAIIDDSLELAFSADDNGQFTLF